jgi:hypothetical protein
LLKRVFHEKTHVFPVFDDTFVSGMAEFEERAVLGGFVADHDFLDGERFTLSWMSSPKFYSTLSMGLPTSDANVAFGKLSPAKPIFM